jgi:hypothetical protein
MSTAYWEALIESLPLDLKAQILSLAANPNSQAVIDSVLRFALQHNDHAAATPDWQRGQTLWAARLQGLRGQANGDSGGNLKRPASPGGEVAGTSAAKKPKMSPGPVTGTPLYILHGISCTSPLRKKLDITIGTEYISFVQPTNGAVESSVKLQDLDKVFLLPTPGKAKAYYTVVLLSTSSTATGDSKSAISGKNAVDQIIFGVDAVSTVAIKTTEYPSLDNPSASTKVSMLPKGAYTLPLLEKFTSSLPNGVRLHDASKSSFRSGLNKGDFCVTAYLRAKEGHLFFFKEGVLFGEKKPCVWYKTEDMRSVRVVSATGKTASVYIDLAMEPALGEEGDEEEEVDTVEFGMIDGREMEGIRTWVRGVESRFYDRSKRSQTQLEHNAAPDEAKPRTASSKASSLVDPSAAEAEQEEENEEESSDEDFKVDSDSDGGEPSSDSDSDSEGGGGGDDQDGEAEGDGDGEDGSEEEDAEEDD